MDVNNSSNGKTFTAVNVQYNFNASTLTEDTANSRAIVNSATCASCHRGFEPEVDFANTFHGGGRVEGQFCNVCHNPARSSTQTNSDNYVGSDVKTPAAASKVFIHRIHNGKNLQTANVFDGINEVTYPQDIRNCSACHAKTAQGDQAYTNPSKAACGSCHDYVDFSGSTTLPICKHPPEVDAKGVNATCEHVGYQQADTNCAVCHTKDIVKSYHVTVDVPNAANCWTLNNASGCNNNTNAAWLAAAGAVPKDAIQVRYVINSVTRNTSKQPVMSLQAADVDRPRHDVDQRASSTIRPPKSEMMDNFQGSPSVYFAFGAPQDGVTEPADFNATVSGYLRQIWNGKATGTGKGTLSAPDADGWYTLTLTGVVVPDTAVMLTGGVGYTYGLNSTPAAHPDQPRRVPDDGGEPHRWLAVRCDLHDGGPLRREDGRPDRRCGQRHQGGDGATQRERRTAAKTDVLLGASVQSYDLCRCMCNYYPNWARVQARTSHALVVH